MPKQSTPFERGQHDALSSLAAWRSLGWPSREACRQHLLRNIQEELAHAQEQARLTKGTRAGKAWEDHIVYFQGHLSALRS